MKTNTIYLVGDVSEEYRFERMKVDRSLRWLEWDFSVFCGTAFHVEFRQAEEKAAAEGLNSQLPGKDWVLQHGAHLVVVVRVVLST